MNIVDIMKMSKYTFTYNLVDGTKVIFEDIEGKTPQGALNSIKVVENENICGLEKVDGDITTMIHIFKANILTMEVSYPTEESVQARKSKAKAANR